MPELPEVETVRLGLNALTCNFVVEAGEVLLHRTIAFPPEPAEFVRGLTGCIIHNWERRGKYLLAELRRVEERDRPASGGWWGVHLRMTGQMLWVARQDSLQKHTRVRIFLAENSRGSQRSPDAPCPELRFVDTRTFGQMWWVPPGQPPASIMTGLQRLGPEPFSADFSVAYFQDKLQQSRRPIKNALLDQRLVAGVGNIYADEALFMSGVQPTTPSHGVSPQQAQRLHEAIICVLRDSIGAGGTTFSDFRDIKGTNGNYGQVAWVYNRTGQPCRHCAMPIERIKLAGRSAHYCPNCQN